MFVDPYRPIFTGPPTECNGSILEGSGIIRERKVLSNGAILMDYKFPEGGHVYHYVSNKNSMPDLFLREFQEIDSVDLKRYPGFKKDCSYASSCGAISQLSLSGFQT